MRKSILMWAGLFSFIGCSSPPGLRVNVSNESGEAIYHCRPEGTRSMRASCRRA